MFNKTINISLILALIVVILGAYTRLADAGLAAQIGQDVMASY